MNPFANMKNVDKNFSNFEKMTLEEACLILNIKGKEEFNEPTVNEKYASVVHRTREISPYLSDRIDGARNRILEEFGTGSR